MTTPLSYSFSPALCNGLKRDVPYATTMFHAALCLLTMASALQSQPTVFDVNKEFERMSAKSLWPGFKATNYPLAIFDGKNTYLFRHPSPPKEFKEMDDRRGVYVAEGRQGVYSNTHAQIGGKLTATAIIGSGQRSSLAQLGALMIHEAFHCHQQDHLQTWKSNEVFLLTYPFENTENLALRRLETAALVRALTTKDDAGFRKAVKEAQSLRERRYKLLGENDAKYERSVEIVEGTAQYVEYRAMGNEFKPVPEGEWPPNEIRQRCYFSGQAWAMILDRLSKTWKDEMIEREELRLDTLAVQKLKANSEATPAFDSLAYDRELNDAKVDVADYLEFVKGQFGYFKENPDWRVVVEADPKKPMNCQGFDPWNYFRDGKQVLHIRYFKAGEGENTLESINHRALSTASGGHPLFAGLSRIEVCDLKTEPKVTQEGSTVAIETDGFKAKFVGATMARDGKVISIKLGGS